MPLFSDLAEPERYLYHYTTREAAIGSILRASQIRFNLFRQTNDPREAKDWWFTYTSSEEFPGDAESATKLFVEATRLAKATTKVLCLTRDNPEAVGRTGEDEFGRGYAHPRMWAQYAGGHTGVCLMFNRAQLAEDIEHHLRPKGDLYGDAVIYADTAPDDFEAFHLDYDKVLKVSLEAVIAEHVAKHYRALFFRKNLDWATELEYRWILRSPEPVAEFVPIRESLRAVVIGHDFPGDDLDALKYLAQGFGAVEVAQCRWRNGRPSILPPTADPGTVALDGIRYQAD
jgi:hypothetical protein